jgi:hypothetical protein
VLKRVSKSLEKKIGLKTWFGHENESFNAEFVWNNNNNNNNNNLVK